LIFSSSGQPSGVPVGAERVKLRFTSGSAMTCRCGVAAQTLFCVSRLGGVSVTFPFGLMPPSTRNRFFCGSNVTESAV
jgi:hypothetical protein